MSAQVGGYVGELKRPVSFETPAGIEDEEIEASLWQDEEEIDVTTPEVTTAEAEGEDTVINIDLSDEDIEPGIYYLVISLSETKRVISKSIMVIRARDGYTI